MAATLASPKINIQVGGTLTNTMGDASAATTPHPAANIQPTLASGISAGQCNRGWQRKNVTIVQGAQETISLYNFVGLDIGGGVGRDGVGLPLAYEEIVAIAITNENAVDAAGVLEVIPADSEGWTPIDSHTVLNGGALRGQGGLVKFQTSEAGFVVLPTTNHRITLRAVGGDVTYSMYLLARHDDDESSSSSSQSASSSSLSASSSSQSVSSSSISTSSQSGSSQSNSSSSLSSQSA